MKFNLGHWLVKPNMKPLYAVEYYESYRRGDSLEILAPCSHVAGRGDTLANALFVTLTSPMDGVIGVTVAHHKGQTKHDPRFELNTQPVNIQIDETDEHISYTSGSLTARVNKAAHSWGIEFISDGKTLTSTGFRAMTRRRSSWALVNVCMVSVNDSPPLFATVKQSICGRRMAAAVPSLPIRTFLSISRIAATACLWTRPEK